MNRFIEKFKEGIAGLKGSFSRPQEVSSLTYVKRGLGNFLMERGIITQEQLEKALDYQSKHSQKKIGQILAEINILGEEEVLRELASYMGVEYVVLSKLTYPLAHQKMFKKKDMLEYMFAPFELSGNFLSIAITDINNFGLRKHIEGVVRNGNVQYHVNYYLSLPSMISRFIYNSYARHPYYPNILGKNRKFGEYLIEKKIITREQMDEVLQHQKKFLHKRIGELIYEMNILERGQTLKELAQHENTEYETLDERTPNAELIQLFDYNFMVENHFVPFEKEGKEIKIAVNNIFDDELLETVENQLKEKGLKPKLYLSFTDSILGFLDKAKAHVS